jgi:predicted nucleic acid-binding protein
MIDRTSVFVDTAYIFALVNTRDQWHARAMQWQAALTAERRPLITSEYVLMRKQSHPVA